MRVLIKKYAPAHPLPHGWGSGSRDAADELADGAGRQETNLWQDCTRPDPNRQRKGSKAPVFLNTLESPFEFFTKSLREESLDGTVELLAEDDGKTWVDIILNIICQQERNGQQDPGSLTILDVPSATSLLDSLFSA